MSLIEDTRRQLEQRLSASSQEEVGVHQSTRWARSITWTLVGTTAFAIGWLSLAQTEEIVVAQGKLEPLGAVKEVVMPLGGVAKEILVKEGQQVKAGQILMRLDSDASAQRQQSVDKAIALKESQLRLKQEEFQRYLELNTAQSSMLSRQLALDKEILSRLEQLKQSGAVPILQYLQQRNKVQESNGKLRQSETDRLRQAAILEQQRDQFQAELADLRSQRAESSLTLRYQAIRAPVDGIVFDLKPKSVGFAGQSTTPVMKLVPRAQLEGKVEIASSDIGFVRVGMPVDVSIDSFPASDFGVVPGTLRQIGSDALPPDQVVQRDVYRYPAQIRLNEQTLKLKTGQQLPLQVGMSIHANIKLRKVTYLQLLLEGFKDKADSLRRV